MRGFPNGAKATQVSVETGLFPRWRGDGREIYYTSAASFGMIMAAAVTPNADSVEVAQPQPLFDTEYINFGHPSNYHTFAVSADGQRFLIPRPEPDTLVVLDREGRSRTLDTDNWGDPHVSPDGKRVAWVAVTDQGWVATVDGKESRPYGVIMRSTIDFTPDGEHFVFVGAREGKNMIIVDDFEIENGWDPPLQHSRFVWDGPRRFSIRGSRNPRWLLIEVEIL